MRASTHHAPCPPGCRVLFCSLLRAPSCDSNAHLSWCGPCLLRVARSLDEVDVLCVGVCLSAHSRYGKFNSVEGFWHLYSHMLRSEDLPLVDVNVFADGIKPAWEDEANAEGGQWVVTLHPTFSAACWEGLLMALIGDQIETAADDAINGLFLSIRYRPPPQNSRHSIAVWNRNARGRDDDRTVASLRAAMQIDEGFEIEYKAHNVKKPNTSIAGLKNPCVRACVRVCVRLSECCLLRVATREGGPSLKGAPRCHAIVRFVCRMLRIGSMLFCSISCRRASTPSVLCHARLYDDVSRGCRWVGPWSSSL